MEVKKQKMRKSTRIAVTSVVAVLVLALTVFVIIPLFQKDEAPSVTKTEAEVFLNDTLDSLSLPLAASIESPSTYIAAVSSVTVKDIDADGPVLNVLCDYETLDAESVYLAHKEELFARIVSQCTDSSSELSVVSKINARMLDYLKNEAETVTGEITLQMCYEDGVWKLNCTDTAVNTCLGGMIDVHRDIKDTKTVEDKDISRNENFRDGFTLAFALANYEKSEPDTSIPLVRIWNSFTSDFYKNFIKDARWHYLAEGLLTTLALTGASLVLGVLLGFIVAIVRSTYLKTKRMYLADLLCRLYVTVVRGTPLMIQLLIIYFVLLLPIGIPKFWAAVLCFGVNSGAYVAEIVRGGIMAVDEGQNEAGRSLGFSYVQTMVYIILPQAFKSVLPALANEFITLLKESSVAFYIGVADLTNGGIKIRSLTYSDFLPLIAVALIYLALVVCLSYLVSLLERRLRKSDR